MTIHEQVHAYYAGMSGEHHRYRSWEHCFRYFQKSGGMAIGLDRDHAALQLGFYLASWGMYRGSSFLLQHAYTVHLAVVDQIAASRFSVLWNQEFGTCDNDDELIPTILELTDAIRGAYRPFAASDTLVTKIILGTFGCMPACDRYFISGFKNAGLRYSSLDANFLEQVSCFSKTNLCQLREEQERIELEGGIRYPLMKLVDMYFWQIGSKLARNTTKAALVHART